MMSPKVAGIALAVLSTALLAGCAKINYEVLYDEWFDNIDSTRIS